MENLKKKKILEKVSIQELHLYLKAIYHQYGEKSYKEYSELISKEFNVICTEKDVEQLHLAEIYLRQDFELAARRSEYFRNLNIENPYE